MKERALKIKNWKSITPLRIPELLEVHTLLYGEEGRNEYMDCKCTGVLRDMRADIVRWTLTQ